MLLARRGHRVLVVDPARGGTDTLSTHALMRGGVLQLHRWGILDGIRAAGTPPVRSTTFHYGDEAVRVDIEPRDGVDALYAPRRTVLDAALVDAALEAGAEVVHEVAVADLVWDGSGTVRGAVVRGPDGQARAVAADVVVGADGVRSRVARLVGAERHVSTPHAAAVIFAYWPGMDIEGYHWHYGQGVSAGAIPTNDGLTCVFVSGPAPGFLAQPRPPLETLYRRTLHASFPELADALDAAAGSGSTRRTAAGSPHAVDWGTTDAASAPVRYRAYPGLPGFLRRSAGPGWALVGDAGYFRDPITAHGITDALRDAELLAHALSSGAVGALEEYQATRDRVALGVLALSDRVASFNWDMEQVKGYHRALSREMKAGVKLVRGWAANEDRDLADATARDVPTAMLDVGESRVVAVPPAGGNPI
jgi:2-polyprenyl-6-methoxyphenol hydroxylase-like FAD-dependent oxidoreductase